MWRADPADKYDFILQSIPRVFETSHNIWFYIIIIILCKCYSITWTIYYTHGLGSIKYWYKLCQLIELDEYFFVFLGIKVAVVISIFSN